MAGQIIESNNIGIWCQTYGNPKNPAILFIMGSGGQGILWRDEFCNKLSQNNRFVIRYDNRDTGKSTGFDFDLHPYKLIDMAEDAIGILDFHKIKKAHVAGLSMGGYIAQLLAIHFSERLLSLTSVSSTINSAGLRGYHNPNQLTAQKPEALDKIKEIYNRPRTSTKEKIEAITDIWRVFNGGKAKFPYDEWYHLAELSYSRAVHHRAMKNHRLATKNSSSNRTEEANKINVPTLVIHGSADPIIQPDHAEYSAKHIPNATLKIIKDMGHLATSIFDEQLTDIILTHTEKKK